MAVANNNYDLSKVEHIIVDDGSTDSTAAVVESYAKKYPHIKFYRKANSNWGGVINYVKDNKLIHNDYVVICDSDDVISRKAFSRVNKSVNDADFAIGGFCFWNGKHRNLPVLPYYYIFKRYMRDRKFTKVYLCLSLITWRVECFILVLDVKRMCLTKISLYFFEHKEAQRQS